MPLRSSKLLSRRHVLQMGAVGCMGLSLPRLLRAEAAGTTASADSCIVIFLNGGPSHLDMWDMKPDAPAAFVAHFPHLHRFLMHKWYFDELYDLLFVRPAMWLGNLFWRKGDEGTIDRFGPHGAAYAVGAGNKVTARLQSGYVYSYALVMLLGLIAAATWVFWWVR